jgi:hypothetical protein
MHTIPVNLKGKYILEGLSSDRIILKWTLKRGGAKV